jgi:hypothetical protein
VRESRSPGSVRGVLSNEHSYRDRPLVGRPHETENKVRLGLKGSLDPKKTLENSITARFTEARTEISPLVAEVSLSFMASLCNARPRGELNSLSYSIFRFVCVALLDRLADRGDLSQGRSVKNC